MYLVFLLTRVNVFLPQTVKQTLTECLHCFISGFPTALPIILISFTATHYKDWLGLKCAGGTTSTQLFHLNNCLAQNRSFISRPTVLNTCTTLIIIPQTRLSNQVKSSQVTFIYLAHLRTTGVDQKCSPVEADGLTIQAYRNERNKEYEFKAVLRGNT